MNVIYVSSGRVARRRLARKEEIFETALRLAEKEGRDALTVNGLAAALDYTPGALYRYFPSKTLLLAELQDYVQRRVLELARERRTEWDARGEGASGSLYRLLAAAEFYLDLRETHPRYANLLGLLIGDPRPPEQTEGTPVVASSALALFAQLEELFAAAEGSRALDPGGRRDKTLAYWAALHGATQLAKLATVEPGLKDSRYYGLRMARTLLLGWGASQVDLERAWRLLGAGRRS